MDNIIRRHQSLSLEKNYFTKETENAIVLYNTTTDSLEKSKIYETYIHWPFFKLTENIIHTFKFYYTEVDDLTHLQHELIIFLLDRIHLFDPSRGTKAYSYFGTAIKRKLILDNKKNYKNKIKYIPIEGIIKQSDSDSIDKEDKNKNVILEEEIEYIDILEDVDPKDHLSIFMDDYIFHCTENLNILFPKNNDAKIADCILELFRRRKQIDIFNKKALYIYIREMMDDVKTPKITRIANQLHKIFKERYSVYIENKHSLIKS
jgi:hypothetical protein